MKLRLRDKIEMTSIWMSLSAWAGCYKCELRSAVIGLPHTDVCHQSLVPRGAVERHLKSISSSPLLALLGEPTRSSVCPKTRLNHSPSPCLLYNH